MAEASFRAVFEADDRSFSSGMRKMRAESKMMSADMIADANAVAQSTGQSVNKVLAEQIALYERRREITKAEERLSLDAGFSSRMASSKPENRDAIQAQWSAAKADLTDQFKRDDLQIDLLREIVATLKDEAQSAIGGEEAAENIRKVRGGRTAGMSAEEEYKARVQADMQGGGKEDARRTMWEVAKGTIIGQMAMDAGRKAISVISGVVNDTDGEIAAAKMYGALPVAGGLLENISVRHTELAEKRDRAALQLIRKGSDVGILQEDSLSEYDDRENARRIAEERARAKYWGEHTTKDWDSMSRGEKYSAALIDEATSGNMPMTVGQSGTSGSMVGADAAAKLAGDKAYDEYRARTKEPEDKWKYEGAGIDTVEFIEKAGRLSTAMGSVRNLHKNTMDMIDVTLGVGGIDEGTALGVAGLMRRSGRRDLGQIVGQVQTVLRQGGTSDALMDRHIQEVVSMSESRYSEGFATVDPVRMAKIKGAFKANFGEALSSADNISSVMGAMAKPKDDFQIAMNYKIYAEQMAKEGKMASYVGFQQWQEKPENGLLGGKMDMLKSMYGTGELGIMAMNAAGIGRTWEASGIYAKGGTNGLSQEEMNAKVEATTNKAEATNRQILGAKMTDEFTKGMVSGISEAFTQVGQAMAKNIAASPLPQTAKDLLIPAIKSMFVLPVKKKTGKT